MQSFLLPLKKLKLIQRAVLIGGFVLCAVGGIYIWAETARIWLKALSACILVCSAVMIGLLTAVGPERSPYIEQLEMLQKLYEEARAKSERIGKLVSQLFGSSSLTAIKFQSVSEEVEATLSEDVVQAKRAADAFGNEPATEKRRAVFNQYIADSERTLKRLDHLVLLLVQFDQDRDKAQSEAVLSELNESIDSLHLYK